MSRVRVAMCVQLALLLAAAAEAQAPQTARPARPTRGLFGRQDDQPQRPQTIDFTMSVSEGYDNSGTDPLAADSATTAYRQTGLYSNLDAGLRYTRVRRERRLTLSAGSAVRYYPEPYKLVLPNYQGAVAFTSPLWRSARLSLSQDFAYTPSYQLELFPSLTPDGAQTPGVVGSDYAIWKQPARMLTTGIQFVQTLSPRSTLQFAYDRRSVLFSGAAGDLTTQGGSIRVAHRFTRYAGFHAGIGSRVGAYARTGGAAEVRSHDLDIGLDYDRPLSFSRRTTLRFSSGSSLVPQGGKMFYRLTGNVSLAHEIARTWTASLRYDRGLQFVEAFPQPFFSDAISAGLKGHPSRKIDLAVSGGYSNGSIGVDSTAGTFGTYTGTAQLGLAVNRHLAVYSEYLYYHYRLGQLTVIAPFPGGLDRQTARVGFRLWLPFD